MPRQDAREARNSSVGVGPVSSPRYSGGSSERIVKPRTSVRIRKPPSQRAVSSSSAMAANDKPPRGFRAVHLPTEVRAVNVGLKLFGDALRAHGAAAVDVDWRIPAGGRPDLVRVLTRCHGWLAASIEAAKAEVCRRLDTAAPLLPGMATA